ncbi:permease [Methanopyrus sp.]
MGPLGTFAGLLTEVSPYLLTGLVLGAALQSMVPERYLVRHLRGGLRSCVVATLLGVPLPLCSCSVLPLAIAAKNRGAGIGPVLAFVVATPQTDVNSLLLSYAMLGPYFTVAKVLSAIATALVVGYLAELALSRTDDGTEGTPSEHPPSSCCGGRCHEDRSHHSSRTLGSFPRELLELSGTVGPWLLVGLAVSVLLELWLPGPAAKSLRGLLGPILAALVGLPLYVCSIAAVPVAATLVGKGASVGSMLTFTVAGPGTNAATLSVIARFLSGRATAAYLTGVVLCAIGAGYVVDLVGVPAYPTGVPRVLYHPIVSTVFTVVLLTLIGAGLVWRLARGRDARPREVGGGTER